ncbi:MAG: TetR/AcrR family transcriptional regulator [Christensenellaceae bacterium]|jgi:AcrR family transcriptional regulator
MNSRQIQREKRRYQILGVGADLFIKKGYSATKITDIAQAADMSVGLLFHYYESKEKLYEALIRLGVSGPKNVLYSIHYEKPIEYFEKAAGQVFEYFEKQPLMAKMFVLMMQTKLTESAPPDIRALVDDLDFFQSGIPIIEAGQKDGSIKKGDPYALSAVYWASLYGVLQALVNLDGAPGVDPSWIVDMIRA